MGSWVLRFYLPAAQKKLGSPWVGPQQVVRQATGHTVGIQKGPDTPIIFIHVDDLKICPAPMNASWTPGPSTATLCASTVAFRPGSVVSGSDSTPSVIVSTCDNASHTSTRSTIRCNLDDPIDLTDHILSPFFVRDLYYQGCRFHSIAHLMCFRYAVLHGLRLFAISIRKWTRHLTASVTWPLKQHLLTQAHGPFVYNAQRRGGGGLCDTASAVSRGNLINDILIDTCVQLSTGKLRSAAWLVPETSRGGLRNTRR